MQSHTHRLSIADSRLAPQPRVGMCAGMHQCACEQEKNYSSGVLLGAGTPLTSLWLAVACAVSPPPASSALSVSDGVTLSQTATATESQIQANARFFICAWQDYSSVIWSLHFYLYFNHLFLLEIPGFSSFLSKTITKLHLSGTNSLYLLIRRT